MTNGSIPYRTEHGASSELEPSASEEHHFPGLPGVVETHPAQRESAELDHLREMEPRLWRRQSVNSQLGS